MSTAKYEIVNKIEKIMDSRYIFEDEPMERHTTFRVGGPADVLVMPTLTELPALVELLKEEKMQFVVIGNGSNLLVGDKGIRGTVIELGRVCSEIEFSDGGIVTAQAGTMLSVLSQKAAARGLTGLEFASGIPGTVGGAVTMNAGAYGGEIKNIIVEAACLNRETGCLSTISGQNLKLSYRHSLIMEEPLIVLSASFRLEQGNPDTIRSTMEELKNKRVEKQPLNFPSAGSTFKRPEGYFAGKLIEDAGLKGYTVGGAQVSQKHAGFVVNKGNATAADIKKLMDDVSDKVFENAGVRLEPEVRLLGEF